MELENDAWQEGTSWVSGDFRNPPEEQVVRGFSLIFRQTRTPLKRKNQSTREVLVALLPFTFHLNFRAGAMLMSCNVALRALEPSLGWVYGWQKFQWQLSKQTRQKKTQSNITFSEDVFSIKNEDMSIAVLVFQRLCDGFNYFFCFAPNLAFDLRHFFYMGGDYLALSPIVIASCTLPVYWNVRLPSAIAYSNCSLFELCRIELWLFLERPNGRSMFFFQLDPSRVKQCLWLEFEGKL